MLRAIYLASMGEGKVAPNPLVGAVLVHNGRIIGEGYHEAFGEAHAEVNAVNDAISKGFVNLLSESTLYVTLEPCSHHGKTPPCTDLILKYRIPKVVVGKTDPFPAVSGNGIKKLQQAGIQVETACMEYECEGVNRRFLTFHEKRRPYIVLKFAQTANHFIAPSDPSDGKRISSPLSDILVHQWRSSEPAIMVGTRTAETDDPQLNVRLWFGKQPVRIVIDRQLKLHDSLRIFDNSQRTIVFNEIQNEQKGKTEWVKIQFGDDWLPRLLYKLYELNIQSVLVEGGAFLLNEFINSDLWDEARIITSEKIFRSGLKAPRIIGKEFYRAQYEQDTISFIKPF